jgi:tetratricopeptide (TPR) repeat protein
MPSGEKQELFAAWRSFFERIADRAPVVMVFGDLHWADLGLMDFIEHLLTWAKTHPILVVALARPELLERRAGWGTAVRNATTVTLEPLSPEPMRELLHGLVPGLPDDAVAAIVDRSEGIPLYAVETVRMLLDAGQLRAEGDAYVVTGPLTDLQVPETLRALVAARLDANDPADRALLTDAAVLGQSFTLAGLAGMTGRDEAELEAALDRLVKRELLLRDDDPRSPERGQYRFLQAVVREVAYESLAKKDRRAKHLAVARHLESLGDDELAGVLASHYLEAYRASPDGPEADALAAQARIALRAAADRAASLHSHASAVHYLEDAITVTTDAGERAALHERAAESAGAVKTNDGVPHADRAAELYREAGDAEGALRATVLSVRLGLLLGRGSDAVAALESALAQTPNDAPGWAAAEGELARAYMLTARFEDAVATADRALAAIGSRRLPQLTADILVTRGTAVQSRLDEAEAILRGAVALADKTGHVLTILRARNNLFTTLDGEITYPELIQLCHETADLARRGGDARFLSQMWLSIADAHLATGEWAECEAALAEAGAMDLDSFRMTWYLSTSSILQSLRGQFDQAEAAISRAETLRGGADTFHYSVKIGRDAFRHLARGEIEEAVQLAMTAATAHTLDYGPSVVAAAALAPRDPGRAAELIPTLDELPQTRLVDAARHQVAAEVATAAGRWDEARAEFRPAIAGYGALGHLLYRSLAGLQFDAYLGQRFEDARQAGVDAEEFFASGGATSFVEHYRGVFTVPPAPPLTASVAPKAALPVDAEQHV